MRLAASLVVRNELHRYLRPCLDHLLEFCDLVVVLDDASDDGTREYLVDHPDDRLHVVLQDRSTFYEHEGQTRQILVDETLAKQPTHVLSIDADEFVTNGYALVGLLEAEPQVPVWSLEMQEIWNATDDALFVREDGGWRSHPLGVLWKAPPSGRRYEMLNRKLACRRVPQEVLSGHRRPTDVALLHFGWTDRSTRQERYDRYTRHDNGRFHASTHLRSILLPDSKIRLRQRPWPVGDVFDHLREQFAGVLVEGG